MGGSNGGKLFTLRNVSKVFNNFSLNIDKLDIPRGEVVVIIGASGSGKTTLLNILSGIDDYEGEIKVTLPNENEEVLSSLLKPPFANIYQHGYLITNSTVSINISCYSELHGVFANREDLKKVCEFVQLVPADDYLDSRAWELSGGEQQRLGIARALFMNPKVIFADEPSSGLDPTLRDSLTQILADWCHEDINRSFLWVTHNYDNAAKYADKVIVLKKGELFIENDTAVFDNPKSVSKLKNMVGVS